MYWIVTMNLDTGMRRQGLAISVVEDVEKLLLAGNEGSTNQNKRSFSTSLDIFCIRVPPACVKV